VIRGPQLRSTLPKNSSPKLHCALTYASAARPANHAVFLAEVVGIPLEARIEIGMRHEDHGAEIQRERGAAGERRVARTGLAQRIAARVRACGAGRLDIDARRRAAHVPRQVGTDLLDGTPLGAGDDGAVDRLDRPHDLVDLEGPAERRWVGHTACGDEVLDEGRGPVAQGEIGDSPLVPLRRRAAGAIGRGLCAWRDNVIADWQLRIADWQGEISRYDIIRYIPQSEIRNPQLCRRAKGVPLFVESYREQFSNPATASMSRLWMPVGASWRGQAIRSAGRSGAPPPSRFQALPLVEDGVVQQFGLTRQDLALACASHSSGAGQVALVREFLQRAQCSERDLMCGPHRPLSDAVAKDYETRGQRLTAVHSNCSGKHTGMLGLAKHHGWPTEFYARIDHPVQQRCPQVGE